MYRIVGKFGGDLNLAICTVSTIAMNAAIDFERNGTFGHLDNDANDCIINMGILPNIKLVKC